MFCCCIHRPVVMSSSHPCTSPSLSTRSNGIPQCHFIYQRNVRYASPQLPFSAFLLFRVLLSSFVFSLVTFFLPFFLLFLSFFLSFFLSLASSSPASSSLPSTSSSFPLTSPLVVHWSYKGPSMHPALSSAVASCWTLSSHEKST